MDRSAIHRALAKAMARRAAGNHELADQWAAHLLHLLEAHQVLAGSLERAAQEPAR